MKKYINISKNKENKINIVNRLGQDSTIDSIIRTYNPIIGFYSYYSYYNIELINIINIVRQAHILNNKVVELLKELEDWISDPNKLKLLLIIDQEFKNLLKLKSMKTNNLFCKTFRDKNIERYIDSKYFKKEIKTQKEYIKKILKSLNLESVLYEIYEEDFKLRNKINKIDYILWLMDEVKVANKSLSILLFNISSKYNNEKFFNFKSTIVNLDYSVSGCLDFIISLVKNRVKSSEYD